MPWKTKERAHEYDKNRNKNPKRIEYMKNRYRKNHPNAKKYQKSNYQHDHNSIGEYQKNNYQYKRKSFLDMYGNMCFCCGETHVEFLTIEHIQGQKGKKKQCSVSAYADAIREYRPDIYQILCMNCNHAKGRYGYCPHSM